MSDEKRKKSWREIDAGRDRNQRPAPRSDGEFQSKLREAQNSKKYRSALEALFEKGGFDKVAEVLGKKDPVAVAAPPAPPKEAAPAATEAPASEKRAAPAPAPSPAGGGDPKKVELRKKIIEALGRDEISRAVDKYLAKWPLPDDWEVLEQALEHTDEARVDAVLGQLETLLARDKPRRARTLVGKLRYIEETADSSDQRARAAALRGKLG
jgi:hypothetical protein